MSDFTRINQPRVDKIMGFLDTIDKSAKSQRVDNADHDHLLDPLRRRLGAIETQPISAPNFVHAVDLASRELAVVKAGVGVGRSTYAAPQNAPRWADMRDMIENAQHTELLDALVWIANRLGDEA